MEKQLQSSVESMAKELLGDDVRGHKDFVWPNKRAAALLAEFVNDEDCGDDLLIGLFDYLLERAGMREACERHGFQALWTADCARPGEATPFLHICCERRGFSIYVIERGLCDPGERNSDGDTLLMSCAGNPSLGLWLLESACADPLAVNSSGQNFLHSAAWADWTPELRELSGKLIQAGLDPFEEKGGRLSPLGFALTVSNDEFAMFLLSKCSLDRDPVMLRKLASLATENACEESGAFLENACRSISEKGTLSGACGLPAAGSRGPGCDSGLFSQSGALCGMKIWFTGHWERELRRAS